MQDFYLAFVKDPEASLDKMWWPLHSSDQLEVFGTAQERQFSVPRAEIENICQRYTA